MVSNSLPVIEAQKMARAETERRRSKRFQMELSANVKAQGDGEHKCATKDLSAGGVFFYCNFDVSKNSPIQLVMILPPEIAGERHWVCCHGRVMRVVEYSAGEQRGVAVKVERLDFLPKVVL